VIEEILAQLKREALKVGLQVNANKTKYMRVMWNITNLGLDLNVVIMYLKSSFGAFVTVKNEISEEIKMRIIAGS
jgi:hypothetical protein